MFLNYSDESSRWQIVIRYHLPTKPRLSSSFPKRGITWKSTYTVYIHLTVGYYSYYKLLFKHTVLVTTFDVSTPYRWNISSPRWAPLKKCGGTVTGRWVSLPSFSHAIGGDSCANEWLGENGIVTGNLPSSLSKRTARRVTDSCVSGFHRARPCNTNIKQTAKRICLCHWKGKAFYP